MPVTTTRWGMRRYHGESPHQLPGRFSEREVPSQSHKFTMFSPRLADG